MSHAAVDPVDAPPGARRLAGEAVARQRRAYDVEPGGVEWLDHLVELDDRSRPAMRDQQRKRVLARGPLVDEVDAEPVDLGGEVVEPVERGFAGAPVVAVGPVGGEFAGVGQRDALAPVVHGFVLRPPGVGQARPQVDEVGVGNGDAERVNGNHSSCLHDRRGVTGGGCDVDHSGHGDEHRSVPSARDHLVAVMATTTRRCETFAWP